MIFFKTLHVYVANYSENNFARKQYHFQDDRMSTFPDVEEEIRTTRKTKVHTSLIVLT